MAAPPAGWTKGKPVSSPAVNAENPFGEVALRKIGGVREEEAERAVEREREMKAEREAAEAAAAEVVGTPRALSPRKPASEMKKEMDQQRSQAGSRRDLGGI